MITCAADILDSNYYNKKINLKKTLLKIEIKSKEKKPRPKVELNATEKLIYDAIPVDDSITLDEILYKVDEIEPNEIAEIILNLESKGYVYEKDDTYNRL